MNHNLQVTKSIIGLLQPIQNLSSDPSRPKKRRSDLFSFWIESNANFKIRSSSKIKE